MSKSEATRRRILDAAAVEFARSGYAGTTLADVARRAGLQTGSLYYHFESREALVSEVLRLGLAEVTTQVATRLDELPPDATPGERLETAIRAHTSAVLRVGDLAPAQARLEGQVPEEVGRPYRAQQRAYGALWDRLIEEARDAGEIAADTDVLAARMLIFGALNWTSEWFRPSKARTAGSIADTAVDVLLSGLLAPDAARRRR